MIEASRSVLFVSCRGRESICRVHLCDCGISCTRIDCACADDLLPYVPFTIIYTATGDVVKVVYIIMLHKSITLGTCIVEKFKYIMYVRS